MNSRGGRYPPGIGGNGGGRGGNMHSNPNYQQRNPPNQQQQQQYVQRNFVQNNQQQFQQQQWLRRNQLGSDSSNEVVEKTIQPEASVDYRYSYMYYQFTLYMCVFVVFWVWDVVKSQLGWFCKLIVASAVCVGLRHKWISGWLRIGCLM